ncbi:uncharacterized protein BDW70DRAFT_164642 [Aspergillus foveolatus]|uniref:uncharacterized protein n=1 Tax=Aspergillus foveolatus TaxID=210207 RepID=UPI003CCCBEBC
MGVVYDPVLTYDATAGVGEFNGSYVPEYIGNLQDREAEYPYTIVPYWMQAIVNNLVTSPMHSVASKPVPVAACAERTSSCDSYLLPGGLINTSPWPPTDHPSAPVIQIANASSLQLDFHAEISQEDPFSSEDCNIYGSDTAWVGIRFCVSKSRADNGSFTAGLYVCPGGGWDNTCRLGDGEFYPNLTTTFSVFSRKTTFITSRSNMSIISVTSTGQPTQIPTLDLINFRAALDWILNFDAANIPGPTSIAEQFWSGQGQLGSVYWSPILLQTFHSIIAFPFWFFNANNLGNMEGYGTGITPNLPPEFYVTASISVPHSKIVISSSMFSIFIAFQAIMHLFIWSVFAWLCIQRPPLPVITSYPLFNFAFKAYDKRGSKVVRRDQGYHLVSHGVPPAGILGASDGDVLNILEHSVHTLRPDNEMLRLTDNKTQQQLQFSTRLATW